MNGITILPSPSGGRGTALGAVDEDVKNAV